MADELTGHLQTGMHNLIHNDCLNEILKDIDHEIKWHEDRLNDARNGQARARAKNDTVRCEYYWGKIDAHLEAMLSIKSLRRTVERELR